MTLLFLLQTLTDEFRLNYAQLWLALIHTDLDAMRLYAGRLGAGHLYGLLACIVSARSWTAITHGIDKKSFSAEELSTCHGDSDLTPGSRTGRFLWFPPSSSELNNKGPVPSVTLDGRHKRSFDRRIALLHVNCACIEPYRAVDFCWHQKRTMDPFATDRCDVAVVRCLNISG